jgi:hypothetical protein
MSWVCQAGVGLSKLRACKQIHTIPSDCNLSIDQDGRRHIRFWLRHAPMRRELFALHLPNPDRVQADYAVLSELSKGLSGGDILKALRTFPWDLNQASERSSFPQKNRIRVR